MNLSQQCNKKLLCALIKEVSSKTIKVNDSGLTPSERQILQNKRCVYHRVHPRRLKGYLIAPIDSERVCYLLSAGLICDSQEAIGNEFQGDSGMTPDTRKRFALMGEDFSMKNTEPKRLMMFHNQPCIHQGDLLICAYTEHDKSKYVDNGVIMVDLTTGYATIATSNRWGGRA